MSQTIARRANSSNKCCSRGARFFRKDQDSNRRLLPCGECKDNYVDPTTDEESQVSEGSPSEDTITGANSEDNSGGEDIQEAGYEQEESPKSFPQEHQMGTHDDGGDSRAKSAKAIRAVNAIERIKELQWRRDQLENHYTKGIRRIIEYYSCPDRNVFEGSPKTSERSTEGQVVFDGTAERMRAGGMKKSNTCGSPVVVKLSCGCTHKCPRSNKSLPVNFSTKLRGKSCQINYNNDDRNSRGIVAPRSEYIRSPKTYFDSRT